MVLAGRLARALGVDLRAIRECRRAVAPDLGDLPRPARPAGGAPPFARWLRLAVVTRGWGLGELPVACASSPRVAAERALGRAFPQRASLGRRAALLDEPGLRGRLEAWHARWRASWGTTVRGRSPEEEAAVRAGDHLSAAELGTVLGRSAAAVAVRRRRLRERGRADG